MTLLRSDSLNCLELLSENEVELTATLGGACIGTVETVSPVDTHQTDHRQEDAHADTCRALDVEGIEVARL